MCRDKAVRDCDRVAEQAAKSLFSVLSKKIDTTLIVADMLRAQMDLNRIQSRQTGFRKCVRSKLPDIQLLLDIHSFPASTVWAGLGNLELVVLDNEPGVAVWTKLAADLKKRGVRAAYVRGSLENDIVLEARLAGVSSVLVEFNESLGKARLSELAVLLANLVLPLAMKKLTP